MNEKPIYTVRVTALECFRMFLWGQNEDNEAWINEPNTIATIQGIESYNVKAKYGTAGHSIIENADYYRTNTGYKVDKFTFTDTQAAPMIRFRREHPLMTREIPLAKLYSTPQFDLIITGTCDHLEGNIVRDTKFKFSSFDVADYMDSCQYKFYLHMLGLKLFYYDFFRVSGFESMQDCTKARIGECESMPLTAYYGMQDDLQIILNEFADWITFKKLEKYLVITPEKQARILRGDSRLRSLIA